MKIYVAAFFMFTATISGCQTDKQRLSKLWFYTYSSGPVSKRDTSLNPSSFLLLRPDGSFTRDFGSFEYGNWSLNNKVLSLVNQKNKTITYPVNDWANKEMQLSMGNEVLANFEAQPIPSSKSEDPFTSEKNLWRIRAASKETDKQIKRRLLNHCQFWEAYFTWALKNELPTIDVRSTPTLIKIYGNGFGLKPYEELPATWTSYFYDAEDCMKANEQISYIFQHKRIAWAHTDNKYKMFIAAFQQLQQYLD